MRYSYYINRSRGMGGFLNPPGHPAHTMHVREGCDNSTSLEYALTCEWLAQGIKDEVKRVLDEWERNKLPLSDPAVQSWIHQVLGYFRGCYRNPAFNDDEQWNVSKVIIDKRDPLANAADHCGVHLIRKYYPEYQPSKADFACAYWGTKPNANRV
jgi:hypothetical protein